MKYAEGTSVSCEQSRAEIERTLRRYGADSYCYGQEGKSAMIQFRLYNRIVRFILVLPDYNSDEFKLTPSKKHKRSESDHAKAWEAAQRQQWRCLALAIKAKLESVESGIASFEEEFLAHIVLPNGETCGNFMIPQITTAYEKGTMPSVLPMIGYSKK